MSSKISGIPVPYEEIEGKRRNSHIYVANGFGYRIRQSRGQKLCMRCVRSKYCPGTATLDVTQKLLIPKREHNHPPNPQEFFKIKFVSSLKRKVEHTDLKLSDFFQTELEKANVKNPHDIGLDLKKIEGSLYRRKKLKNQFVQLQARDDCSPNLRDDETLETLGTLPSFSYDGDANNLNVGPVSEVNIMEVEAGGSSEDDSCSKEVQASEDPADVEDSTQECLEITTQAGAEAKDSNRCSPQQQPFFAKAARASPGPQLTLHTKQPSHSHADGKLPAIAPSDCALSSERYQLRHNNHLSLLLNQLAEDEAFMDVTLTAEGRQVKAHKNVLSAVSPYFSDVLRGNPCQHPIIIMPNDVHHAQLVQIISFIYRGEVSVPTTELLPLMKVADQLLITGLSQKGNLNRLIDFHLPETEDLARSFSSLPLHPSSLPRETPRTDFNAAGTSGGKDSAKQTKSKKLTSASDRILSHSKDGQATRPVSEARDPLSVESAQDSDEDDSDGFDADFLDPTPVGSPSNNTPVIDVDLSLIKEENFTDESTVKLPDLLQEDPLHDPYPSSSDLLDSVREDTSSSRVSSRSPRITRRKTTTNDFASTSSSHDLNPRVRSEKNGPNATGYLSCLEQAGPSAKGISIDSRLDKTGESAKGCKLGYTNLSSEEHDPYVCPYCCRSFRDLTDHFSNNHITQPAFICSRCRRVYTDKAVFIAHRTKCD